jgi:hypothetical protein
VRRKEVRRLEGAWIGTQASQVSSPSSLLQRILDDLYFHEF